MKKPLIGVTPSLDQETKDSTCRPTYLAAIRHAGGIPVILPLKAETEDLKQLVETLDGFLFTGGPDIHHFISEKKPTRNVATFPRSGIRWSCPFFLWSWQQKSRFWASAAESSFLMSAWAEPYTRIFPAK